MMKRSLTVVVLALAVLVTQGPAASAASGPTAPARVAVRAAVPTGGSQWLIEHPECLSCFL